MTDRETVSLRAINKYTKMGSLTARDALIDNACNYTVVKKNLYVGNSRDPVRGIYALGVDHADESQSENQQYFGVCTDRYKIVQNYEVAQIADSLPIQGANIITMGSRNGSLMLTAKMNTVAVGTDQDTNDTFINFMWGHDGKSSVSCFPSSVRAFCQNAGPAMMMDARNRNQLVTFRHMGDVESKMRAAREALEMYTKAETTFVNAARYLASAISNEALNHRYYDKAYDNLFGVPSGDEETSRKRDIMRGWHNICVEESSNLNTPINGWLAFNSVTRSAQRSVPMRGKAQSVNNKISSLFTGKDNYVTNVAFNTALQVF